jgi:hypothetical protein
MGFYSRYIFPRMMNWGMSVKTITPFRQEILSHAQGKVFHVALKQKLMACGINM